LKSTARSTEAEANHRPLPDQTILPEDEGAAIPPAARPVEPVPPAKRPTPPTGDLLSAARRVRNYKKEGRGPSRQLDIRLRATPDPEVYFRLWPDVDDEEPVAILKLKDDSDRTEVYVLHPDIADLPYVSPKVRDARLVPYVTTTGKLTVWAKTEPDPSDRMGYRIHSALERAAEAARRRWILITWASGQLQIGEPRTPIEDEPKWPTGQSLGEIFNIAMHGFFIDSADHPIIKKFDVVAKEV
jgi:hypothetical protein